MYEIFNSLNKASGRNFSEAKIHEAVNAVIKDCDLTGDGQLSYQEFEKVVVKHSVVLHFLNVQNTPKKDDDQKTKKW